MSSNSELDDESISIASKSLSSVSQKSQKIKRRCQRRQQTNYGSGRPGPTSISQLPSEQELSIQRDMENIWFGTDISTKCLIFLCKKGSMTLKVKTGKPAEKIKKEFVNSFTKAQIKQHKKYKKDFKKKLKEKQIAILRHLGYSAITTYLLLSNNVGHQIDLKLNNVSHHIRQGLLSLIKYLSPQFTYTYKVIVECFYSSLSQDQVDDSNSIVHQEDNQTSIVRTIVKKLKDDKQNHKMIFDLQLIQELLLGDFELIRKIENEPFQSEFNQNSKTVVGLPNFNSYSFRDQVNAIEEHSNWIDNFVSEFVEILQQYQ